MSSGHRAINPANSRRRCHHGRVSLTDQTWLKARSMVSSNINTVVTRTSRPMAVTFTAF